MYSLLGQCPVTRHHCVERQNRSPSRMSGIQKAIKFIDSQLKNHPLRNIPGNVLIQGNIYRLISMRIFKIHILLAIFSILIACDLGSNDLYEKAKRAESEEWMDEFSSITPEEIEAIPLSGAQIDGSDPPNNDLPDGTIVVYQTSSGRYGKFQVITWGVPITIKWVTYESDYSVYSSGDYLEIHGTWSCDLDEGIEEGSTSTRDFFWQQATATERYLTPQNGAQFSLY
jgi:hypothetical protein